MSYFEKNDEFRNNECIFSAGANKFLTYEEEVDVAAAGVVVQQENFVAALDKLQAAHSDTIGAPKVEYLFFP